MNAVKITVEGKVQGVFYRKYTQVKALELGLSGFVKNQTNGTVLIIAVGSVEKLQELQDWCWKGSPGSRVTEIKAEDFSPEEYTGFSIYPT